MPVEEEVVGLQENMEPLQSCEKTVETVSVRTPKRKLSIARANEMRQEDIPGKKIENRNGKIRSFENEE
ncbi:hypothetical protein C0J52_21409 [Blattella germanica]|nr:hypothetical protein C0J52_21409 [Blattella germanica]